MDCALTIAGSDPTGGAGIQADLRVFHALGVHGLSVIAALTAQNTSGVESTYEIDAEHVRAQLDVLLRDIRPAALKTGMLHSAGAVEAVAVAMEKYSLVNLVVDPVMVSTSGRTLLSGEALNILRKRLLPLARIVTPNMKEASGMAGFEVRDMDGMERAARAIRDMGPEVVVITGGHLGGDRAADVLLDADGLQVFESPRRSGEYHGTGCAFSASITALLALGQSAREAVRRAKELINDAIRDSFRPGGGGMGILRF